MIDARPTPTDAGPTDARREPAARPIGRAGGLEPDHEPDRRARRGIVADHHRRRALPRLLVGDRGDEHGPRPSARRRGRRGPGPEAAPRPAEHRLPRARACASTSDSSTSCRATAGAPSCRTAAPRRSRPRSSWPGSRPAGRSIIAFRGGYHGRTAQTMALTTAKDVYRAAFEPLPGSVYHTAYPYCYRAAGRRPSARRLHLRLGGPARPDVPPVHLPGPGGGDHHRAGPRRGRLHRPAARASCRASARSPASTGSCSSPTRSRPASAGPAGCSRSSTGASSRTS